MFACVNMCVAVRVHIASMCAAAMCATAMFAATMCAACKVLVYMLLVHAKHICAAIIGVRVPVAADRFIPCQVK